jgi:hypothetical protein
MSTLDAQTTLILLNRLLNEHVCSRETDAATASTFDDLHRIAVDLRDGLLAMLGELPTLPCTDEQVGNHLRRYCALGVDACDIVLSSRAASWGGIRGREQRVRFAALVDASDAELAAAVEILEALAEVDFDR